MSDNHTHEWLWAALIWVAFGLADCSGDHGKVQELEQQVNALESKMRKLESR